MLRVLLDAAQVEARPVWKPMHKQPCYKGVPAYVNGVSEALFKVGMCLPAGPYVSDDDVRYIVETIKGALSVERMPVGARDCGGAALGRDSGYADLSPRNPCLHDMRHCR